jgi:hypothetical protein
VVAVAQDGARIEVAQSRDLHRWGKQEHEIWTVERAALKHMYLWHSVLLCSARGGFRNSDGCSAAPFREVDAHVQRVVRSGASIAHLDRFSLSLYGFSGLGEYHGCGGLKWSGSGSHFTATKKYHRPTCLRKEQRQY